MRRGTAETPQYTGSRGLQTSKNLGRMIGHAQRPRYVAIVLSSFFLTLIVSVLPPRYFGPRPALLTVDFTKSSTLSFCSFTIQAFLVHSLTFVPARPLRSLL